MYISHLHDTVITKLCAHTHNAQVMFMAPPDLPEAWQHSNIYRIYTCFVDFTYAHNAQVILMAPPDLPEAWQHSNIYTEYTYDE